MTIALSNKAPGMPIDKEEAVVAFAKDPLQKIAQALVDCSWALGIDYARLTKTSVNLTSSYYRAELKAFAADPKFQDTELGVVAFDLNQVEEALDVLRTAGVELPSPHC